MQSRLRPNKADLLNKILKKESKLLKTETADYFNNFYNKDVVETKEESDAGVSDYMEESEASDSFDSDFEDSETSNKDGASTNGAQDTNLRFFRAKKSRRDKYFKKGFDIVNFNFESLAQPKVDETAQKKTKKRKAYVPVKKRQHFIHELYPQSVLLKNALNLERYCLMVKDHKRQNDVQDVETDNILDDGPTCDMKIINSYDDSSNRPMDRLYFRSDDDFHNYFKDLEVQQNNQKEIRKSVTANNIGEYQLLKRQKAEKKSQEEKELLKSLKDTIKFITSKRSKAK